MSGGDPVRAQPFTRRLAFLRGLAHRVSRRLRWATLFTGVLVSIVGAAQALGFKLLVDAVAGANAGRAGLGLLLAIIGVGLQGSVYRLYDNLKGWIAPIVAHEITTETLRRMAALPTVEHLERPDYLDQVQLVRDGGQPLFRSIFAVLDALLVMAQVAMTAVLLATVHPILALLPVFSLPQVLLIPRAYRIVERADAVAAERDRAARHLHGLFADMDAAMELRVFGATGAIDGRADTLWRDVALTKLRGRLRSASVSSLGWLSFGAGFVTALVVVIAGAARGWATPGDVLLVAQLAASIRHQVALAASALTQLQAAGRTVDRALWLEDFETSARAIAGRSTTLPTFLRSGVFLQGVSFMYPGTSRVVLDNVDLHLPAGHTVAVVGQNGAGKTTLVKLLCGYYRPDAGRILVDDIDLADVAPDAWQLRISGAFQDHLQLEESVRRSVGFGDQPRLNDDQAVIGAMERGDAAAVVNKFPAGLETHLGKTYRDGVQLSGGQWQRIAVSRAMMRNRPLLLVLDEPTAALDPAAEHRLYQRYASAADETRHHGGVTLLISHRFSSVRMADLIVVLDKGRVVEKGTHEELLRRGNLYAAMFRAQATAYR